MQNASVCTHWPKPTTNAVAHLIGSFWDLTTLRARPPRGSSGSRLCSLHLPPKRTILLESPKGLPLSVMPLWPLWEDFITTSSIGPSTTVASKFLVRGLNISPTAAPFIPSGGIANNVTTEPEEKQIAGWTKSPFTETRYSVRFRLCVSSHGFNRNPLVRPTPDGDRLAGPRKAHLGNRHIYTLYLYTHLCRSPKTWLILPRQTYP
ncbi:hypothetical protein V2G26_012471 [Clonostachys chloroleuca]